MKNKTSTQNPISSAWTKTDKVKMTENWEKNEPTKEENPEKYFTFLVKHSFQEKNIIF